MTEKQALSRVLSISREAYSAMIDGSVTSPEALLNAISETLSHFDADEKMKGCMKSLKRDIKQNQRRACAPLLRHFSPLKPTLDYDYNRALRYIDVMIYGNRCICEKLSDGECEKAMVMAEAMRSMPGFMLGDYDGLSSEQYYDLVFGIYPKQFGEPFMEEKKAVFTGNDG